MSSARERSCTSKRGYDSREGALFFGKAYGQRAYRCHYCGKFHLSSALDSKELERRERENR